MRNLIEIFAQQWVGANVISDASHESILAWKKTYSKQPDAIIDPKDSFKRDIMAAAPETLSSAEERYLISRTIAALGK